MKKKSTQSLVVSSAKKLVVSDHRLEQVLCSVTTPKEAELFIQDFLTTAEAQTLRNRLEIYLRLSSKQTYQQIRKELGVSSATISVAAEHLQTKGVQLILKLLSIDAWASTWSKRLQSVFQRS